MSGVPALHIRNVPEEVYEGLRERARARGTSMNAEAIEILGDAVRLRQRSWEETLACIDELSKRWNLSPDAPAPEELIRRDRDSR